MTSYRPATVAAILLTLLAAAGVMRFHQPVPPVPADPLPVLAQVRVVASVPDRPGYDRSCARGHACVFGPRWVPADGAGCDVRNQVLADRLHDVTFKPGTKDCVVMSGLVHDPYTGQEGRFDKADAGAWQIDHVLPLAVAWDLGAADWPADRRHAFAVDQRNLVVTAAAINQAKSDRTPATWTPDTPEGRCLYADLYADALVTWDLPATPSDVHALARMLDDCGRS